MRRTALLAALLAALAAPLLAQTRFIPSTPAQPTLVSTTLASTSRDEQQVRQWYRDYLGREPGPELKAWVELLRGGMSPLDVQATILGSDEFYNQKGRDPQAFLIETLQSITWNEPTISELRRWTDRLNALRGDRFAVAREMLIAGGQSPGSSAGGIGGVSGPQLADLSTRLASASKLLVDTIDLEIGGTLQGRQANLKAQALGDAAEQFRRLVAVTGYRPTDATLALQNVARSLTALQSTLNNPAGTAPGAAGIARRITALADEAELALRPAGTSPRPGTSLPGTSVPGTIGGNLGGDSTKLLAQAQAASRAVESIIQSLTGTAYNNYSASVTLRDLDTLAAALGQLQTSIQSGSSRQRLEWELQALAEQAVRIAPQMQSRQMPAFTRLFWSSVESNLEQMGDTLGITGDGSTVLRPTPAEPDILPLVDQALSRTDVFLTGTQPLVFGVPEVPRVQRDVRNLKSRLLTLRQEAQQGEPASRLLETLNAMVADYQNAFNRWGQIVTQYKLQNPPRLSPIGESLNEVERLLKLAANFENLTPTTGSVGASRVAQLLQTIDGQMQQYRGLLPAFVNYPEHKGILLYCDQIQDYLATLSNLQQNPTSGPDALRRQAAGLSRVIGLLSAQTDSLDARARALGARAPREAQTLRGISQNLIRLADDLENQLH
jgi:hypothetical protein